MSRPLPHDAGIGHFIADEAPELVARHALEHLEVSATRLGAGSR